MSLLNNALRAAEHRQKRPEAATAYVGQNTKRQSSVRWLIPLLLLIILILAVTVLYGLFNREPVQPRVVEQNEVETAEEATAPAVDPLPTSSPIAETSRPVADAAVVQVAQKAESRPVEKVDAISMQPDSLPSSPPVSQPELEPPVPDPVSIVAETTAEAPAVPAVKQQRETPEAADMRASRKLSRLLQEGKLEAAEALMGKLEKKQVAPVSRGVLARSLLVQGLPDRALRWLSPPITEDYPTLRLLRSRGLLATGNLSGAVATLLQEVPPIKSHIEYRVTLATLLQQSGQGMASARQWSALIAVDDGQAAWWVGLAIALESQGEAGAAVRAYGQAAQLPGLSPSLADYVRERMHKLQAG